MDDWPEFVIDAEKKSAPRVGGAELTGWETVIFEVEDDQDGSAFSTAALAP